MMTIGELVQLKSGGPVMTIIAIDDAGLVTAMWYAQEAEEFRSQTFPPAVLDDVELDDEDEDEDEA